MVDAKEGNKTPENYVIIVTWCCIVLYSCSCWLDRLTFPKLFILIPLKFIINSKFLPWNFWKAKFRISWIRVFGKFCRKRLVITIRNDLAIKARPAVVKHLWPGLNKSVMAGHYLKRDVTASRKGIIFSSWLGACLIILCLGLPYRSLLQASD